VYSGTKRGADEEFKFSAFKFPTRFSQSNGFDCGVYMLNCAKILAFWQDVTKLLTRGKMEEVEEDLTMEESDELDAPPTTMVMPVGGNEVKGPETTEADERWGTKGMVSGSMCTTRARVEIGN
jgi:hypothetical protein